LPYVVVGNIVRVLAIVFAGEWFGQAAGSRVHDVSGILVFLVVLGLLLGTLALLRRVGFARAEDPVVSDGVEVGWSGPRPLVIALVVVVVASLVAGVASQLGLRQQRLLAGVRLADDGLSPIELPTYIGTEWVGRHVEVSEVEHEVLPADTGYSRKNYVAVADLKRQVFVSVVLSGRDRTSIHRPELCLVGQGWTITERLRHEFSSEGTVVPMTLLHIEHAARDLQGAPTQAHAILAYFFAGGDALEPTHAGMLWRDAYDRVRHLRADRWAYVVVQTMVVNGDEGAALTRMQEVVAGVWPALRTSPIFVK
jgi:hypothetical protein